MDKIKKYWAVFVNSDLEKEYRLTEYLRQVPIYRKILLVNIIGSLYLITTDYSFFRNDSLFYVLLSARLAQAFFCIFVFLFLKKKLTLKQYDYVIVGWIISVLFLLVFINYSRPENYIGFIVLDAMLVVLFYNLLAVKLSVLLSISIGFSILEFLIIFYTKVSIQSALLQIFYVSFIIANVIGYLIAFRQQTAQRMQFYLLGRERKLKQELEKSNRDKDKIFSVLAHDLKNLFNSIYNNSELMLSEYKTLNENDLHDSLTLLNESAGKIKTLLNDLLEWAKMQMGKLRLKKEIVNLYDLVRRTMEIFEQRVNEKGIILKSTLDKNLIVTVDETVISTVLRNIISNAIKFTERNGIIFISAENVKNNLEIVVKDTGVGIDEEKLGKLFSTRTDEFSEPGTEDERGSGIGLYICRE